MERLERIDGHLYLVTYHDAEGRHKTMVDLGVEEVKPKKKKQKKDGK